VDSSALSAIPVFAQLAGERREEFAEVCEELDVEAGTTLIREGDFGYAMFAVRDWAADVLLNETVLRNLGPGDVFGEIAILSGGRRTATVVARSAMRLIAVMNRDVWRLERSAPEVAASLRKTIADCLAR